MVAKSKAYEKEVAKLRQTSNKDFIQIVRQLRSSDPKEYWRLINNRLESKVEANLQDRYNHFKELTDDSADEPNHKTLTRVSTLGNKPNKWTRGSNSS